MSTEELNPYKATAAPPIAGEESKKHVRAVGKAQRLVNIALLFYLLFIPINIGMSRAAGNLGGAVILLVSIVLLCMFVFIVFSVVRLAHALHGTGHAILYGLAMFVPFLGFLLLLILNSRATTLMRNYGIKVGLLGAKPKDLP